MVKSYLSIALRYMIRHKGFSLINIAGLTIGIACSLLIALYIYDEWKYDTFHADASRIYRIGTEGTLQGRNMRSAYTGAPLAGSLKKECNDVQETLRLASWATFPMRHEERTFTEPNLLLADPNFFRFFTFRLVVGHPDSVLNAERKIVITESAARRYFDYTGRGDRTPLGKTMVLAQGYTAQVSGIAEDPPANSHIPFTFVLSMKSWDESGAKSWVTGKVISYFKLGQNAAPSSAERVLDEFTATHINPELEQLRHVDIDRFTTQGNHLGYFLQPLLSIHLHSDLTDEIGPNGDIQYIYLFGAIAIFITLLACINFMNLSTARSASRAKEVGVRKTVGAPVSRLITQFLMESCIYITVAVVLAMLIVLTATGPFNALAHKQLDTKILFTPAFGVTMLAFILLLGIVAGSYPAFYLTTFSPIDVMKGRIRARMRSYGIRNALVVFQFFISTGLIIATLVVYDQLQYTQRVSLGFDKRNIIDLLHTANLGKNAGIFKSELLKHEGVVAASYCNRLPPNIDWQDVFSTTDPAQDHMLAVYEMDYDHLKTMKYEMVIGRFFSADFPTDSTAIILNEKAVEKLNLRHIGEKKIFSMYGGARGVEREVIGVMRDFNFRSLKDPIQPMAIVLGRQPNWEMAVRIKEGYAREVPVFLQSLWKKYAPDAPFEYTFLDQNFEAKHQEEKRVGLLFLLFTVLAVAIACLGLFGLATFTTEQRIKEIGIRKVVGATVTNIVFMLNKDFLKLVLIANLLAWPVAWWLITKWLDQFAYHTPLRWWIFVLAGMATALIASVSVSFQAIRAAKGNPVNSLRDE